MGKKNWKNIIQVIFQMTKNDFREFFAEKYAINLYINNIFDYYIYKYRIIIYIQRLICKNLARKAVGVNAY